MASAFTSALKALFWGVLFCTVWGDNDQSQGPTQTEGVWLNEVVVVVLTQPHPFHADRAEMFRQHFAQQLSHLPQEEQPELVLTHETWPDVRGAWTLFPLFADLAGKYKDKRWLIVCEEETRMDVLRFPQFLQQHDEAEEPFLGRALRDQQSVIIHHFAFHEDPSSFAYPDFGAGVAFSMSLVKRMADKIAKGLEQNFAIDPKHELAKFLMDDLHVRLTPVCELCGAKESTDQCQCVTWQPTTFPMHCGDPVDKEDLFVAVKTCSQYHKDRVPVVKATWGKEAELIEYYSELEDPLIPTINLGVPNTERGHCGKTAAILQRVAKSNRLASVSWLLIADDDTIINLDLLRRLLACYKTEDPLFLGERYGYSVHQGYGYNYITGGGGMVFNRAAVKLLAKEFRCPQDDSPDDMLLGLFFTSRGIPITHSPHFHQARPEDYSEDLLSLQVPVSFHKHWNTDPYKVYDRLKAAKLPPPPPPSPPHEEL
ncbi:beta-1,3-glucosyltransferase-like [Babylonia areolata]|uniref:beta-1,3-glucosyltransferase-like n=1 Tax=Babylonia areolata TaxID=304850 RepID=UPI003FCF1FCC